MHDISSKYLLQIEPKKLKEVVQVDDVLTQKMETLLAISKEGTQWRGWHTCQCGEFSGSSDLLVAGYITNSLAAHYLRWHRNEVPESEIEKLKNI